MQNKCGNCQVNQRKCTRMRPPIAERKNKSWHYLGHMEVDFFLYCRKLSVTGSLNSRLNLSIQCTKNGFGSRWRCKRTNYELACFEHVFCAHVHTHLSYGSTCFVDNFLISRGKEMQKKNLPCQWYAKVRRDSVFWTKQLKKTVGSKSALILFFLC